MHVSKRIDLARLAQELATAGVAVAGLGLSGTDTDGEVYTYTVGSAQALPEVVDLPPEAAPIVSAHVAPPRLIDVADALNVHAIARTTDATPLEVFRFPCQQKRLYRASLTISGIDVATYASKILEGRFTWKRNTQQAILVGATTVSDIHDAAAAALTPNVEVQGADVVFTVTGVAARTVDWLLAGSVETFAPSGL